MRKRGVPSDRELEIRSLRRRVKELTDERMLDYPYSKDNEAAFQEQYDDMMRNRESEEQERMRKMGGFKGNY